MAIRPPRFRTGPHRALASGFVLMILSAYLVILTGMLDETIGMVVAGSVSTDSVLVRIGRIHTDLFWRSTVDTVEVLGRRGLYVRVCDGEVEGALHVFLLARAVERVSASRLDIEIPRRDPNGIPRTLAGILDDIDRGIVCSADSLSLEYGRISDSCGPLLDSMRFAGSVSRGRGISVSVVSASTCIRGLGRFRGSGQVSMRDGVVESSGFSGMTPFGNLYFTGWMNGSDGSVEISSSGTIAASLPDLPFSASMDFAGTAGGTISRPEVEVSLMDGSADYGGTALTFSADTAIATLDGVAVRGLELSWPGASMRLDGSIAFAGMEWQAGADVHMSSFDPSALDQSLPSARMSGSARADLEGDASGVRGGSLRLSLGGSTLGDLRLDAANLEAVFGGSRWSASGDLSSNRADVSFTGSGLLGEDLLPLTYRGRLVLAVPSSDPVSGLLGPGIPRFTGLAGEADVAGTRTRISLDGSLSLDSVAFDGGTIGGFSASGSMDLGRGHPEGLVSVECEALSVAGAVLSLSGSLEMSRGEYRMEDLSAETPGGYRISAAARCVPGDTTLLDLAGIGIDQSKLRLVQDGALACRILPGGTLSLDTSWVKTPQGTICMSGTFGPDDTLDFSVFIASADFASLASALHLGRGVSGVGSLGLWVSASGEDLDARLQGRITGPSFGPYSADSLVFEAGIVDSDLEIPGFYSWDSGNKSGFTARVQDVWTEGRLDFSLDRITSVDFQINHFGDWVFYALPIPLRTRGADIVAHARYEREYGSLPRFDVEASAMADRLIVTSLDMPIDNVVMYLTHHYPDTTGFTTRISAASAGAGNGVMSTELLLNLESGSTGVRVGRYRFSAGFESVRTALGGFAALVFSGSVFSGGNDPAVARPLLAGKIDIEEGLVGMPQSSPASSSVERRPLPFDLLIALRSNRGVWFRNSLADIEIGVDVTVFTQEGYPEASGTLRSLRGSVHLLDKDFRITGGTVELLPGDPPEQRLSIIAETDIRGAMDRDLYHIIVSIEGSIASPSITLVGTGPFGELAQEDVLALLAVGITYGELQQMDSGAMQSQLEDAAQGYVGRLLARSLRGEIGLDELQLTPELLADSTSLTVDVGKYILPDLFVSFSGDVFSTEPGTISAQYYFHPDLYVTGSTKSTLHGEQEPSLELHYTLRY